MGAAIWAVVLISATAAVVGVSDAVQSFAGNVNEQAMVAKLADDMPAQGGDSQAIINAPTDINGVANCNAQNQCNEVALYFRTTSGDQYVAYDYVPPANGKGTVGALKVYTFSGFTSGGAHQNPVLRETIPMTAFSVHPVLASQMNGDAQDPYATLMSNIESQARITPQDITLNYGPPLAVAHNAVYIVTGTSSTGYSYSFDMAQRAIAPKNQVLDVGSYAPTPAPSVGSLVAGGTLVYHWPSDPSGPTQFQVSEAYYHDAFFAEQQSCTGIAAPNPNYVPGTSPTYYPSSMWGTAGPWVYPNPNPTAPPGQNSGPATFSTQAQAPGYCQYGIYDAYTNRTTGSPDVTIPVDVMGAIQLTTGSGWSSNVALLFPTPTSGAQGVTAGKTFDAEQLNPTYPGSPCSGIAVPGTTGYSTQATPNSAYTTASFQVAPAAGTTGGTCTLQVGDQYSEPSATVNVTVSGGLFVGDGSATPVGSITLVSNGSGGWVPHSLDLWKRFLPSAFSGTVNYGNCGGYAYITPSAPGMGNSSASGQSQYLPFSVNGSASTQPLGGNWMCTMSFSDNYGESTTLGVVVDPQPTPTPIANPCAGGCTLSWSVTVPPGCTTQKGFSGCVDTSSATLKNGGGTILCSASGSITPSTFHSSTWGKNVSGSGTDTNVESMWASDVNTALTNAETQNGATLWMNTLASSC